MLEAYRKYNSSDVVGKETDESFGRDTRDLEFAAINIDLLLYRFTGGYPQDWSVLRGLRVADLGCGSRTRYRMGYSAGSTKINHPEFCRLMGVNGAEVYGVDIDSGFPYDEKLYTHVIADLVPPVLSGALSSVPHLKPESFDMVHANRFVGIGDDTHYLLAARIQSFGLSVSQFRDLLIGQAGTLLKEGGVLGIEGDYRKRVNGALVELA